MPPANDNLANATVVSSTGWSTFPNSTNDDATEETGEVANGYFETVWWRIEPDGDSGSLIFRLDSASYNYNADLYIYPGGGTPSDFADLIDSFNNLIDSVGGPGESEIIVPGTDVLEADVYYLVVYGGSTNDTGTFDLEIFNPAVFVLDAEDYANLSSGTVSIVDTNWVKDDQYREYDFSTFDTSKGPFDYTPSLIFPANTVAAGRYRMDLYSRPKSNGGPHTDGIIHQIENGGEKMNPAYGTGWNGGSFTDNVAAWRFCTDETGAATGTFHLRSGGPLFVDTSKEIKLAWGQTSEDEQSAGVPQRYLEAQQVRFVEVPNDPLPASRWINMFSGNEPWDHMIEGQTRVRSDPSDPTKFYACGHFFNRVSNTTRYSIWQYDLTGDVITLADPAGLGDTDLKQVSTSGVWWRDFTVMPDGDIYLISQEQGTTSQHRIWLKHWNGTSWTTISGDIGGHTAGTNWWQYTCSIDNDGEDLYMAWGEHKSGGSTFNNNDWGIRVKKYDVSGASFTELGTSSGGGLSAYPSNYSGAGAPFTQAGHPGGGLKLRVAPDGTPWLIWTERNTVSPGTNPTKNLIPFVYYWDGAAWQDSGYAVPATPPASFTGHSYSATPSVGNNYSRVTADDQDPFDMIFQHADGSESDYPAIVHEWVWNDQIGSLDWVQWAYSEYDGANWSTPEVMDGGTQWPFLRDVFETANYFGSYWSGGMSLVSDGSSSYFVSQLSQSLATQINVGAVKINADGTWGDTLGGTTGSVTGSEAHERNMVDTPSNPGPWNTGGNWINVVEPGVIVNGRVISVHHWDNGWSTAGLTVSLWKPGGGIVSMNWRSGERYPGTRRVLVGE